MDETLRLVAILGVLSVVFFTSAFMMPNFTGFTTSTSGTDSNLTIWDQTDAKGGGMLKYTYPTNTQPYFSEDCNAFKSLSSSWDVYFYANYTNSTSDAIDNTTGNCMISLNKTGSFTPWINMTYNETLGYWQYHTNFTYKGDREWKVNCTSSLYDDLTLSDTGGVTITNSPPCIFDRYSAGGPLKNLSTSEDQTAHYYLNLNSTDDDYQDQGSLTYGHGSSGWGDTYMSLDASGHFTILVTSNSDPSLFNVTFTVTDTDSSSDTAYMLINVNFTNDAPVMSTLPTSATEDTEFNETANPESVITATDEESNTPFVFNLTFVSCQKAHWIPYPTDNCTLFNFTTSEDNLTILNFTPTNWDVGTYQLNFTVTDNGSQQFGYNATAWQVVWFNVTNVNDPPSLVPLNGTDVQVNQSERLYVAFNGTDIENDTLLFNATTLVWNDTTGNYSIYTNASFFPINTNNTGYPNASSVGIIDLIANNNYVGNYTLNVTLTDNGSTDGVQENLTQYMLINISVLNVNDPPALENLSATLPMAVQELPYRYYYGASDPDLETPYGDTLSFGFDFYQCETPNGTTCDGLDPNSTFSVTKTGVKTAMLYVFAVRNDTGNYTLNMTVTDSGGLLNWTLVELNITADEAPVINATSAISGYNQSDSLFYRFNVTDPEDDPLNITNVTLYRNLTTCPSNLFPVGIDSSGYPPLINLTLNYTNLTNAQVGNYTLEINATDKWNRTTTHHINISIGNINDPPQIINWTACDGSTVYPLNFSIDENTFYCIKLNDPDPDLLVPKDTYNEKVTYLMELISCNATNDYVPSGNCSMKASIDIDYDTGIIGIGGGSGFTPENETWHGNYTYNLTINDTAHLRASRLFTMEIRPVNDPPVFTNLNDTINMTSEEPFYMQLNATDEENNTPFTFGVSFTWCDTGNCDLFTINGTTGEVNFTPDMTDVGNYTANFTVTDAGNLTYGFSNSTGWNLSDISVERKYHSPTVEYVYPTNPSTYNMTEGTTRKFSYEANDTTDNDPLDCYWYVTGTDGNMTLVDPDASFVYIQGVGNIYGNPIYDCNTTPGVSGFWSYTVSYDDALNLSQRDVNITLVVRDPQGFEDNYTVQMTAVGSNRPPRFQGPMQDPIQWYSGMTITPLDLDDYFIDDYGEVLTYTYSGGSLVGSKIGVSINVSSVTFSAPQNFEGETWIYFIANDSEYTNTSDNITLRVLFQEEKEVDKPVSVYTPRTASLDIVVDDIVAIDMFNSSLANLTIINDGQYDLKNINLTAVTNESNITLALEDTLIPELLQGESFTTHLNISLGMLNENQTYLAYIFATTESPAISESATITIKVNPSNQTKVIIKLIMVKDLFEENPECMELYGLITQAEQSLRKDNIEEALRLTQLAVDNCNDMIDYAKLHRQNETAAGASISGAILLNPLFVMGFITAILALAMFGYWMMARRQSSNEAKKMDAGD